MIHVKVKLCVYMCVRVGLRVKGHVQPNLKKRASKRPVLLNRSAMQNFSSECKRYYINFYEPALTFSSVPFLTSSPSFYPTTLLSTQLEVSFSDK